jgi:CRISPR-associated protein Cmr6
MPIYAPPETREILGNGLLPKCESRALFKDRFADPEASDQTNPTRKEWFYSLTNRRAERPPVAPWLPEDSVLLYGRLMARLVVDLANGVMENANVKLDRYGLPIVPGTAVKGCARRMALQALHDWIEANTERPASEDACGPCCDGFVNPAQMLAAIARIFGWTPEDWKGEQRDGRYKSDFAWATGGRTDILNAARAKALDRIHENFAGSIAFLAGSPNRDPGLELDVVTPHHTKFYQDERGYEGAPDTEDPVPVYFPAVKPQGKKEYFSFPLIPLRLALEGDVTYAKRWLASGLELFGLGSKTNAGYGWFDASEALQESVQSDQETARKAEADRKRQAAEQTRLKAEADEARLKKEKQDAATEGMSEDEKADYLLAQLTPTQFEAKVKSFFKESKRGGPSDSEKKAIVRALRGPQGDYWTSFKARAAKGGDLGKAEQAIRTLNKQLFGDKMP